MNNLPVLKITSNFRLFTAILVKDKQPLCYTYGEFTSLGSEVKKEEKEKIKRDIATMVCEYAKAYGIDTIEIEVKGPLSTGLIDLHFLESNNINVRVIKDKTPIPHNGCVPNRRIRARKFNKEFL